MIHKIAIIGGGLSGTLTAIHLLQKAENPTQIILIEKNKNHYGKGLAYASNLAHQPLNVPIGKMSLFSEKNNHFFDWLEENQHLYPSLKTPIASGDFVPRKVFGAYLNQTLQQSINEKEAHIQYLRIIDEVIDLEDADDAEHHITIRMAEHTPVEVHQVVFALGNFPPADIINEAHPAYHTKHYASFPWSTDTLENLSQQADVLLVGSGLTMIDLAINLQQQGHEGKIHVLSRNGLLPQIHQNYQPYHFDFNYKEYTSVLDLFKTIRKACQEAIEQGYDWRAIIDSLRDVTPSLWQQLSKEEQKRFMRHVRPLWEVHRHRLPSISAQAIEAMQQNKQLKLYAGRIKEVALKENTLEVSFRTKRTGEVNLLQVDKLINCTGPQCNYRNLRQPLIENLLKKGWIQTDDLHLGIKTTQDGRVIGQQVQSPHIWALGSMRKGTLWETTALREIRQQVEKLIQDQLLKKTSEPSI